MFYCQSFNLLKMLKQGIIAKHIPRLVSEMYVQIYVIITSLKTNKILLKTDKTQTILKSLLHSFIVCHLHSFLWLFILLYKSLRKQPQNILPLSGKFCRQYVNNSTFLIIFIYVSPGLLWGLMTLSLKKSAYQHSE